MRKLFLVLWALLCVPTVGVSQPLQARLCFTTNGSNCIPGVQAASSVKIDTASAATVQLVALSSGQIIYVTSWDIISAGTTVVKLLYGTGSNCGTGATDLTGPYPLVAQAGIAKGNGLGLILFVPKGNAICISNSAAVQISGSLSYSQF